MKARTILRYMAIVLCVFSLTNCKEDVKNPSPLAPVIIASDPVNSASETGVAITISATFSESMDAKTINGSTFLIKQGSATIPGTVVYANKKATFTPLNKLGILTYYQAVITTGAHSSAGRPLAQDYSWSFTTCHPPTVESTTPARDAICVLVDQPILAFFGGHLAAATVTTSSFFLSTGTTNVPGTVTYLDNVATFTPLADLLPGTVYTATLTTAISNDSNMPMENPYTWSFTTFGPNCDQSQICPPDVDLKTAGGYGILAGTAITNVGFSVINDQHVGISPGFRSSVTGFPPAIIVNGNLYAADDIAPPGTLVTQAKTDLTAAYLTAAAATSPTPVVVSADLGGRTLGPGIYTSASTMLLQSGDLILDGGVGDCDTSSVWIFQVGSALTTIGGGGGNVILINGAQAKHVFWQIGSSATIGDGTSFKGTVMALTSITVGSGTTVEGRVLARNGAVTLSSAGTINKP